VGIAGMPVMWSHPSSLEQIMKGQNNIKILKSVTVKGQNHYCTKDRTEMFIALYAPVNESPTFKSEWHVCGLLTWRRHSNFVNFLYKVHEVAVSVLALSNHENVKQGRCCGMKKYQTFAIWCFCMQMYRIDVCRCKEHNTTLSKQSKCNSKFINDDGGLLVVDLYQNSLGIEAFYSCLVLQI
jgi:hypothetical protein